MKHGIVLALTLTFVCSIASFAQQEPVPASCHTSACTSFRQLLKAGDSDVALADSVCFYEGDNPANEKELDHRTQDEFFLLMAGRKLEMREGGHPKIFVGKIINGLSDGYSAYRQHPGGLETAWKDDAPLIGRGYYNDGSEMRLTEYRRGTPPSWWLGKQKHNKDDKPPMQLASYEVITVRRSTGRFVHYKVDRFHPQSDDNDIWWSEQDLTYTGRCFSVAGRKLIIDQQLDEEPR